MCLLCSALWSGCSVREDRSDCPCRLVLDFGGVDTSVVGSAELLVTSAGGFSFEDELDTDDLRVGVDVEVPREVLDVGVWSVDGRSSDRGAGLVIPVGEDCPEVYFHVSSVKAEGEMVCETVRMRKNHCVMDIRMVGLGTVPVRMGISGNVDGYMPDGSPSAGVFHHEIEVEGYGRVVLPRQTDNSLMMEVYDDVGVVRRFALGEYVAESGYDWDAPDLEDITLEMDVAVTGVKLAFQGYEKTFEFEIEI